MKKTTLKFDEKTFLAARHRALDEGVTLQALVAKAVEEYLQRHRKRKRDENT